MPCSKEATDKGLPPPKVPDCFFGEGKTEDDQFKIIKEAMKKLVEDTKAFESKPTVYMLSGLPVLSCCPNDYPKGYENYHTGLQLAAIPIA